MRSYISSPPDMLCGPEISFYNFYNDAAKWFSFPTKLHTTRVLINFLSCPDFWHCQSKELYNDYGSNQQIQVVGFCSLSCWQLNSCTMSRAPPVRAELSGTPDLRMRPSGRDICHRGASEVLLTNYLFFGTASLSRK